MAPRLRVVWIALVALVSCAGEAVVDPDAVADSGPPETRDSTGPASGLVVYDLSPSSGPLVGGTEVVLQGDGFRDGLVVSFGGVPASVLALEVPSRCVVSTPAAPSGAAGPVDVTLSNPGDGAPYVLAAAFRYAEASVGVTWCRLVFPPELTAAIDVPSTALLARVRVEGVTGTAGPASGVFAEAGFGPAGADVASAEWSWGSASFHADADSWFPGDRAADEYTARLRFAATGEYDYTVRFSTDGQTWTPCDLDGGAFDPANVGHASVVTSLEPGVAWARFVGPAAIRVDRDAAASPALGRVVTTGQGSAAPTLLARFGRGPRGSLPTDASWSWLTADLRGPAPAEAGDPSDALEYGAAPPTDVEGVWSTAWRFSADDGTTWVHGDLDGSDNEPSLGALGLLRVGRALEDCRFDVLPELTVGVGDLSPVLSATVTAGGLTDAPGPAAGVLGQLGWGPPGSDPRDGGAWAWTNAGFQVDSPDLLSEVFAATLSPSGEGDLQMAFRFTADGGAHWLTCDRTGSADGFSPDDLPLLHVVPPLPTTVGWCRLQGPLALQVEVGNPSLPIVGHVVVPGRTAGEGPGFGVRGALGVRALGSEFSWSDAVYTGDAAGPTGSPLAADAYRAVVVPSEAGVYQTAFRFSADGGETWTECDADGSADGFEAGALGSLSAYAEANPLLQEVVLDGPLSLTSVAGWHTPVVRARARVPGFTDAASELAELTGALGFGALGSLPVAGGWTWSALAFDAEAGAPAGFHGYAGTIDTPDVGSYDLAARFSLSGVGAWVYGDGDGSANGYATGEAGRLTVVAPAQGLDVPWCAVVSPAEVQIAAGAWSPVLRGEVFVPNLTAAPGWGSGVVAQVGLHDLANSSYEWFDASWAADAGTNDAYEGRVRAALPGAYVAVFRFSTSGGVNFTSCDANGPPFVRADGVPVEVTP